MAGADSTRICEIDGCNNPYRARGMCGTHWSRWKRHGDPNKGARGSNTGTRRFLAGVCSVEWCGRESRARFKGAGPEYCAMHYLQVHQLGAVQPQPAVMDPSRDCEIDGCTGRVRSPGAAWCEKHYARNRRRGTPLADVRDVGGHVRCVYCGEGMQGQKYCSARCAARNVRGNPRYRECNVCSAVYEPVNKGIDRRCCSDECKRIQLQQYHDVRRMVSGLTDDGRKARYAVLKRDNWVCQICGDPTDRTVSWPHPMYPTIDHIIPVSKGGQHTESNLQCAHARCNIRKQATMPAEAA